IVPENHQIPVSIVTDYVNRRNSKIPVLVESNKNAPEIYETNIPKDINWNELPIKSVFFISKIGEKCVLCKNCNSRGVFLPKGNCVCESNKNNPDVVSEPEPTNEKQSDLLCTSCSFIVGFVSAKTVT